MPRWRLSFMLCIEAGSVRIIQSPAGFTSLGSRLLLSCSYTLDHTRPVKVSWLRGNDRVEGSRLMIHSVQRQDDGRYTCLVDTGARVLSADTLVRVQCTFTTLYSNIMFITISFTYVVSPSIYETTRINTGSHEYWWVLETTNPCTPCYQEYARWPINLFQRLFIPKVSCKFIYCSSFM